MNAEYKEPRKAEFALFSLLATLPVVSIDAERAARRIVPALKRGEGDVALGAPALLATRFHGLFPGLTADLFGLANRYMPREPAASPEHTHRGLDVERELDSRAFEVATTLGPRAAERLNEVEPDGTAGDRPERA